LLGKEGPSYFSIGDDTDEGTMTSIPLELPAGISRVKFLRAGGADAGSGLYVKSLSGDVLCAAETGTDTDTFFYDSCDGLDSFAGDSVQLYLVDTQNSSWGAVFIDDIKLVDENGVELSFTPALTTTTETSSGTTESSTTESSSTTPVPTPAPTPAPTLAPGSETPSPTPGWPPGLPFGVVITTLSRSANVNDTDMYVESTDGFALGAPVVVFGQGNAEDRTIIGVGYPSAFSRRASTSWWSLFWPGRALSEDDDQDGKVIRLDEGLDFSYLPGSFVYIPPVTGTETSVTTVTTTTPFGYTREPTSAPSPAPTPSPTHGSREAVPIMCDGYCEEYGPEGHVCSDDPVQTLNGASGAACFEACVELGAQCQYFAYNGISEKCKFYETCTSFVQPEGGDSNDWAIFTIPLKADYIPAFYR